MLSASLLASANDLDDLIQASKMPDFHIGEITWDNTWEKISASEGYHVTLAYCFGVQNENSAYSSSGEVRVSLRTKLPPKDRPTDLKMLL